MSEAFSSTMWAVRVKRKDGTHFYASGADSGIHLSYTRPNAKRFAEELEADGLDCDIVRVRCEVRPIGKPNRIGMRVKPPPRTRLGRPVIGPAAAANMSSPFTSAGADPPAAEGARGR
jgi:hypothetical protein